MTQFLMIWMVIGILSLSILIDVGFGDAFSEGQVLQFDVTDGFRSTFDDEYPLDHRMQQLSDKREVNLESSQLGGRQQFYIRKSSLGIAEGSTY